MQNRSMFSSISERRKFALCQYAQTLRTLRRRPAIFCGDDFLEKNIFWLFVGYKPKIINGNVPITNVFHRPQKRINFGCVPFDFCAPSLSAREQPAHFLSIRSRLTFLLATSPNRKVHVFPSTFTAAKCSIAWLRIYCHVQTETLTIMAVLL